MGWVTRNIPAPIVGGIRRLLRLATGQPQVGHVNFGDLRRVTPLSKDFGVARGGAVDRHFIETFLQRHRADIRGRVLEIGEDRYTSAYGGSNVTRRDILHRAEGNTAATIVADLAAAPQIPDDTFDCLIVTQTLQYLFHPADAVATMHRILRPGGVLLLTVPASTLVDVAYDWPWYWSFTTASVQRLLGDAFGADQVECTARGNVLAATAQLYGIAATELTEEELEHVDPDYQVVVTARAVKR